MGIDRSLRHSVHRARFARLWLTGVPGARPHSFSRRAVSRRRAVHCSVAVGLWAGTFHNSAGRCETGRPGLCSSREGGPLGDAGFFSSDGGMDG